MSCCACRGPAQLFEDGAVVDEAGRMWCGTCVPRTLAEANVCWEKQAVDEESDAAQDWEDEITRQVRGAG